MHVQEHLKHVDSVVNTFVTVGISTAAGAGG